MDNTRIEHIDFIEYNLRYGRKTFCSKELCATKKEFLDNLTAKIGDPIFQNDIKPLTRDSSEYDLGKAFEYVKNSYIALM